MPNLATVLKDEITRLARRALSQELTSLRKLSAQHRSAIAGLKRTVALQSRELALLKKKAPKTGIPGEVTESDKQVRWNPERFKKLREKLDLSAEEMGLLLNASGQSVYKWEGGIRPRHQHLVAIAAARKLGKREAHQMVQTLKDSKKK